MSEQSSSPRSIEPVPAAPWLEEALLFCIVVHGLALIAMPLLLLTGLPGGGNDLAERVRYISDHPWLWRLGWLPWQLCALSDLLLALAFLRTRWIPHLPAVAILLVTLIAVCIEQPGEYMWSTVGSQLAAVAHRTGNPESYLIFEDQTMLTVGVLAAIVYLLAGICWTIAFRQAGVWNSFFRNLSLFTWLMLAVATLPALAPPNLRPAAELIATGNALGFALLMIWLCTALELVLTRSRPITAFGGMALWHHPGQGFFFRLLDALANLRLLRFVGQHVPFVALRSDIKDVVYVNLIVEANKVASIVPSGLQLDRLGVDGQFALLSVLTFRHGHLGPRFLGPLRSLLPNSIQSNWRVHVVDPISGSQGIYFVHTAISHTAQALMARALSDGVSMHVPWRAQVTAGGDQFAVEVDPGNGSAPDLVANLYAVGCTIEEQPLPVSWSQCFSSYGEFLDYCVPQDGAMYSQPWYGRVVRQEITLNISRNQCQPLTGEIGSRTLSNLVGDLNDAVCFRVPVVNFLFSSVKSVGHHRR